MTLRVAVWCSQITCSHLYVSGTFWTLSSLFSLILLFHSPTSLGSFSLQFPFPPFSRSFSSSFHSHHLVPSWFHAPVHLVQEWPHSNGREMSFQSWLIATRSRVRKPRTLYISFHLALSLDLSISPFLLITLCISFFLSFFCLLDCQEIIWTSIFFRYNHEIHVKHTYVY